ncbi:hypothetical protein [Mycoplasmopsis bovis]|nr:hypothetical protein [Mycoplasmopsis bovis]
MRKRFKPLVKRHIKEQDMDVKEIHLGKDQQNLDYLAILMRTITLY